MDFKNRDELYNASELKNELLRASCNLNDRERSVPELYESMSKVANEVFESQEARMKELNRLDRLLKNGDLDKGGRRRVERMLERIAHTIDSVKFTYNKLDLLWQSARIEYRKDEEIKKRDEEIKKRDKEIQERDKRVSDLYGKNMELDEENEKLKERCVKAKKRWWWDAWEPTEQGLEGIKREFVGCVKDLKGMADTVRDWCRDTGVKPEGVNIEGIKNEDLIIWVANECLWKKLPDGMREKICANKDHTMFSWENFKTTRKRLSKNQQYVNAPTRSKNDRHREGVPMAREVDGT